MSFNLQPVLYRHTHFSFDDLEAVYCIALTALYYVVLCVIQGSNRSAGEGEGSDESREGKDSTAHQAVQNGERARTRGPYGISQHFDEATAAVTVTVCCLLCVCAAVLLGCVESRGSQQEQNTNQHDTKGNKQEGEDTKRNKTSRKTAQK